MQSFLCGRIQLHDPVHRAEHHPRAAGPEPPVRLLLSRGHLRFLRHGHQRASRPRLPYPDPESARSYRPASPAGLQAAWRPVRGYGRVVPAGHKDEAWGSRDFDLAPKKSAWKTSLPSRFSSSTAPECGCCIAACGTARMRKDFLGAATINRLPRLAFIRDNRSEDEYYDVIGNDRGLAAWGLPRPRRRLPQEDSFQDQLGIMRRMLALVRQGHPAQGPVMKSSRVAVRTAIQRYSAAGLLGGATAPVPRQPGREPPPGPGTTGIAEALALVGWYGRVFAVLCSGITEGLRGIRPKGAPPKPWPYRRRRRLSPLFIINKEYVHGLERAGSFEYHRSPSWKPKWC